MRVRARVCVYVDGAYTRKCFDGARSDPGELVVYKIKIFFKRDFQRFLIINALRTPSSLVRSLAQPSFVVIGCVLSVMFHFYHDEKSDVIHQKGSD